MSGGRLTARGLSLGFPGRPLLRDLDIDLRPGTWLGLIGPNGAGKSALVAALSGQVGCRGRVELDGRRLYGSPRARSQQGLGVLAQGQTLVPSLSPRRHFELLGPSALPWLERVAPGARVDRPTAELDIDDRAMVGLGLLLARAPRVLLLDEPLAGLSPDGRRRMLSLLAEARRTGSSALWIEHLHGVLREGVDRVLRMEAGRLQTASMTETPEPSLPLMAPPHGEAGLEILDGPLAPLTLPKGQLRRVAGLDTPALESVLGLRPSLLRLRGTMLPADPSQRRRAGLGGLFDPPRLVDELGMEAHLRLSPWSSDARRLLDALLPPGIPRAPRVGWASGGERRALGLALALAGPTQAIAWTNPRAGLVPEAREALEAELSKRMNEGLSVLESAPTEAPLTS